MKVKPKRTFSWYLENGMFYLFIIFLTFNLILFGFFDINFEINKTVGWLFDWSGLFHLFYYKYSAVIYFIGFLTLLILKKKTNKKLSIVYLTLILLVVMLTSKTHYNSYIVLKILALTTFLLLFFDAILRKKKKI